MKKLVSIFIALILVSSVCVFADSMSMRLKSVVHDGRISISAANEASSGGLYVLSIDNIINATEDKSERLLISDYDIAQHDIDIKFSVIQTQKVQTLGKINLTATVGNLILDTDNTKAVEASAAGSWETSNGILGYEDAVTVTAVAVDNVVSIEIKYIDDTKEVPPQSIGAFTAKWEKDPDLATSPGLYRANVTLSYTVE